MVKDPHYNTQFGSYSRSKFSLPILYEIKDQYSGHMSILWFKKSVWVVPHFFFPWKCATHANMMLWWKGLWETLRCSDEPRVICMYPVSRFYQSKRAFLPTILILCLVSPLSVYFWLHEIWKSVTYTIHRIRSYQHKEVVLGIRRNTIYDTKWTICLSLGK